MLNLQLVQQNCPFRFMWSSGALKRRVCEIVEGLMAGFTAVTLLFHLSSTCFNNVFTKSHNKMAIAMWTDKNSFMLLYLDFINCTNRSRHRFRSRLQAIYKLLFHLMHWRASLFPLTPRYTISEPSLYLLLCPLIPLFV